jgi:hypothetical protein
MTDFILIHGAWHGSRCWARVRRCWQLDRTGRPKIA